MTGQPFATASDPSAAHSVLPEAAKTRSPRRRFGTLSNYARPRDTISLVAVIMLAASVQTQDPRCVPAFQPKAETPPAKEYAQGYRIKTNVDLVVLHTTVTDSEGRFVPDLKKEDFRVFENRFEQKLALFSHEDLPVTMGLVIDNSGSMRRKRAQVNAAAMTFVRTSNSEDEAFVVNFNVEPHFELKEDFTKDPRELNKALMRIDSREGTALYDAVIASLDHIRKGSKDKKILLVITDGDDNTSRNPFPDAVEAARQSDATIYAIGVFSEDDRKDDKKMVRRSTRDLTVLAEVTGGAAFFPDHLEQIESICTKVARDVRDQYTLGYYSSNAAKDGTFRTVRVEVKTPMRKGKLTVHTRTGYYAQKPAWTP